jgi:hypothetical protein
VTAPSVVVLVATLVFTGLSVILKHRDDRSTDGPRETTRQWLGLEEGEEL